MTEPRVENLNLRPWEETKTIAHPCGNGIVNEVIWPHEVGIYKPVQLTYIDEGDQRFDIGTLLPEAVRFGKYPGGPVLKYTDGYVLYGDTYFDPRAGKTTDFWATGSMFALLHEIGHAKFDNEPTPDGDWARTLLNSPFSLSNPTESDVKRALGILKSERRAWAFALKTLKNLRVDGIDLEPELPTMDDLIPSIYGALFTYERQVMRKVGSKSGIADEWEDARNYHISGYRNGRLSPRYLARYAIRPDKGLPSKVPPISPA
jgi:hypothetical protein